MFRSFGLWVIVLMVVCLMMGFTPGADMPVSGTPKSAPIPRGMMIDSIVVRKAAHQMEVFAQNEPLKIYRIHLGIRPVGQKQSTGDYRTPEGLYSINVKNPNSNFHKSLGISYPNSDDIRRAQRTGRKPGGDIMIHGLPNGEEHAGPNRYQNDWTWGCIALSNAEIDELYQHTGTGVPILITP